MQVKAESSEVAAELSEVAAELQSDVRATDPTPMSMEEQEEVDEEWEDTPEWEQPERCFCNRKVYCCLICGMWCRRCCHFGIYPRRWKCWSLCLLSTFFLSFPGFFLAMHFLSYPGNWEGDFPITGSRPSDFIASRSDGKLMRGLTMPVGLVSNSSKKAPVVFFGGNAQGMSGAMQDALWLLSAMSHKEPTYHFQVFTTVQRGYNPNSGFVTQDGVTKDAQDFLDHALNSTHGSLDGRVILAGWSMGAGVALQLAAARPEHIAGVVVFSPWSSLRTETLNIWGKFSHLLYLWIWLTSPWDSLAAISSLPADIPVAVVSAGGDMVIHSWQHRDVYDAANASHKWWLQTPGANHADLPLEIKKQEQGLTEWTKASWERVQKFGVSNANATHHTLGAQNQAFAVMGDAASEMSSGTALDDVEGAETHQLQAFMI